MRQRLPRMCSTAHSGRRSSIWLAASLLITALGASAGAGVVLSPAGDRHDTVPVFVNGRGPYPFILDTGADSSAVYQWFAEQAHLAKAGHEEELSGQTGTAKVPMYRVDDLQLESRHIRHVVAYGLPNRHDAGREAGVLGNDYMDGALVVFDFPCRRVEIHDGDAAPGKWGADRPPVRTGIDKGTTVLTVSVTVNGFTGVALLDTGSRDTRLTPNFARAAGIDPGSARFHDGAAIYGANSKKTIPRSGPIGTVRLGGVEVTGAMGQVAPLPALEDDFKGKPAMVLGADLLARFRLLYDHQGRKVWFLPSQCMAQH